jgi:hypothetical protein
VGDKISVYISLTEAYEKYIQNFGQKILGRLWHRLENNIKMGLKT